MSVANNDPYLDPSYLMSCIESLIVLCAEVDTSDAQMIAFLLVPRIFGGPDCLPFSAFCYLDPLTSAISLIRSLNAMNEDLFRVTSKMIDLDPFFNKPEMLINDPFCLNIKLPEFVEGKIRRMMLDALDKTVVNETLTPLFHTDAASEETKLLTDL